jgi:hypothetical protein
MASVLWIGMMTMGLAICIVIARSRPGAIAASVAYAIWWGSVTAFYRVGLTVRVVFVGGDIGDVNYQTVCLGLMGVCLLAGAIIARIAVIKRRDRRERVMYNVTQMQSPG